VKKVIIILKQHQDSTTGETKLSAGHKEKGWRCPGEERSKKSSQGKRTGKKNCGFGRIRLKGG